MTKKISDNKLLDLWSPPGPAESTDSVKAIVPISFISTTFTFDSEFFEEECLFRFLCMETEKENDGVAFLIEREDKLAGLKGSIVIVDQNNCRGDRSLRWDLAPCRVAKGVMHAKITILHWSNCIRLIIGSANLTKMGCCVNQEIFGVVDYTPNCDADFKVIKDVLGYLTNMISQHCGETIKARFSKQQEEIQKTLEEWNIKQKQYRKDDIYFEAVFVSPDQKDAFLQLKTIWDRNTSSPPYKAYITSPFFDPEEYSNTPNLHLFDIMKQRGAVEVNYNVTVEPVSETETEVIVNAPEFLKNTPKPKSQSVYFHQLDEMGINENGKPVPRPMHLKSIWLTNDDYNLFMIGSSNFTSPGLGLGNRTNYEANLVYGVNENRNKKGLKVLKESCLHPETKLDVENLRFKYRIDEDSETPGSDYINLPDFFGEAVLCKNENEVGYYLELNFNPHNNIEKSFKIFAINNESKTIRKKTIYDEEKWNNEGRKGSVIIEWAENVIPDYLEANWLDSGENAFWPLIVKDQITLPPVEELRNLPFDALLHILSSSQPLHRMIKILEKFRKKIVGSGTVDAVINALDMVDSSGFLLQRTRKVSYAMNALRNRLEKPVFTNESLRWRLYGPIGVNALKDAIVKEAKSDEEKMFLLAELALELSQIQPRSTDISLDPTMVKSAVKDVINGLSKEIQLNDNVTPVSMYAKEALRKALNEL